MTSLFPRFLGDAPAVFGILSGAMHVCVFAIDESNDITKRNWNNIPDINTYQFQSLRSVN